MHNELSQKIVYIFAYSVIIGKNTLSNFSDFRLTRIFVLAGNGCRNQANHFSILSGRVDSSSSKKGSSERKSGEINFF